MKRILLLALLAGYWPLHAFAALQPYIMSFSPVSGAPGTVVTINGSGFTGLNAAWVGAAHDGTLRVVNDGQVLVTIPADATTGAIGPAAMPCRAEKPVRR